MLFHIGKIIQEEIAVETFCTGEDLYRYLKENKDVNLVFLDIILKTLSGVVVGKMIREELKNDMIHIVYISAYQCYAMELFENRPLQFLVKPLLEKKVKNTLEKGIALSNRFLKTFEYRQGHNTEKAFIKNILYFESLGKEIRMVTIIGENFFYGSLQEIFRKLEGCHFFYCHKSYLFNYYQVKYFSYEQLKMNNDDVIPIAQPRRKLMRRLHSDIVENEKL